MFQSFIENSEEELNIAFKEFNDEGIDELILDLRYNGGGRLDIANHLASLITGNENKDEIFSKFQHNNKYSQLDSEKVYKLSSPLNRLVGMSRIFVITSEDTASASEAVINSLKPYFNNDVILIGTATHGKPVGMYSFKFYDLVLAPISFKVNNANGEGGYFDGIQPDCISEDDLSQVFGNEEEGSLEAALYYIEKGECPTVPAASAVRRRSVINKDENFNGLKGFRREIGAY